MGLKPLLFACFSMVRRSIAKSKAVALGGSMVLVFAAALSSAQAPDLALSSSAMNRLESLRLESPALLQNVDTRLAKAPSENPPSRSVVLLLAGSAAGNVLSPERRSRSEVEREQQSLLDRLRTQGARFRVIAQTQILLNAIFLEVETNTLSRIQRDQTVLEIRSVSDYVIDHAESADRVYRRIARQRRNDGKGVRVAVLDSGIDYTHRSFGGPGTAEAYLDAFGVSLTDPRNQTLDGLFPTERVVGGYDFVGGTWPLTPDLSPDPDPIDAPDLGAGGHGTHVADLLGGANGVAPGVDLYAVKVCSSVTPACSGIALIQGLEFAVDPNGDGDPSDAVDIINLSLGSDYGSPFDDIVSRAVDQASALGVLTVASAGNGGDKPYVQGTPAAANTAISVAQTEMPSNQLPLIEIGDSLALPAILQPWSVAPTNVLTGPVVFGDGQGGNRNGCAAFEPGSLEGAIVLVDRGTCTFTAKVFHVQKAGGIAAVIGLIAAGDPFAGAFGGLPEGEVLEIPGYMISRADAGRIRGALPSDATIDPAKSLSLAQSMVGTSARGPQIDDNRIKPEIGAPGAGISASSGGGERLAPFGGTSGAAPVVSGAAALVLSACEQSDDEDARDHPRGRSSGRGGYDARSKRWGGYESDHRIRRNCRSPLEIKSLLMNAAETQIVENVWTRSPAPISRIGAGEVRARRAARSAAALWDAETGSGIAFGQIEVADEIVRLRRRLRVRNFSDERLRYRVTSSFRFLEDVEAGAIALNLPPFIEVEDGEDFEFDVEIVIDATRLPGNFMNSGSRGANPRALTLNEFDGYVELSPISRRKGSHRRREDRKEDELVPIPLRLPWHILPRRAARVELGRTGLAGQGEAELIPISNHGAGRAQNDAYALIAVSGDQSEGGRGELSPTPDIAAIGVNTFPVGPGLCAPRASFVWAFAVHTHERQRHLVQPVSHEFWLDIDRDGQSDVVVLNRDGSFYDFTDGRQFSWAVDLRRGLASAFFFAEHATNTGNTVLYVCAQQLGLAFGDMLNTQVDVEIFARDFYHGGPGDQIEGLTITPLGERFFGQPIDLRPNTEGMLRVLDFGPFPGNTPELGLLLITNGDRGEGARGGATIETEALQLKTQTEASN
jgi:subtilisin family serine protease